MIEYKVIVDTDGITRWYNTDGKPHREDDPAVECTDDYKLWYIHGKRHRLDGPAVEHTNGNKYWFILGKLHREDGSAIERADGSKKWYIHGKQLTEEEFNQRRNTCNGRIVEIEGKQYELKLIRN